MTGHICKMSSKGYGFIRPEGAADRSQDHFFLFSDLDPATKGLFKMADRVMFDSTEEMRDGLKKKRARDIQLYEEMRSVERTEAFGNKEGANKSGIMEGLWRKATR